MAGDRVNHLVRNRGQLVRGLPAYADHLTGRRSGSMVDSKAAMTTNHADIHKQASNPYT